MSFQQASHVVPVGKNQPASTEDLRDVGSIPGSGRPLGEGNGNTLQYSCLENPMYREAWWATVHGVAKSQKRLSNFIFTSLSTEIKPSATIAVDLQQPLREFRVE